MRRNFRTLATQRRATHTPDISLSDRISQLGSLANGPQSDESWEELRHMLTSTTALWEGELRQLKEDRARLELLLLQQTQTSPDSIGLSKSSMEIEGLLD